MRTRRLIITVDGPSGAGKTTVARMLATRLSFRYVDTGALYRAVGWWVIHLGLDLAREDHLMQACETARISVGWDQEGRMRVACAGKDVTEKLRGEGMGMVASQVSARAVVRQYLWRLQRDLATRECLVFEGRDMGSQVFPDAPLKFFLTASLQERARRRWTELLQAGHQVTLEQVIKDMCRRDHQDSNRQLAPLRVPDGAVVIDTTGSSIQEVLERMMLEVRTRLGDEVEATGWV